MCPDVPKGSTGGAQKQTTRALFSALPFNFLVVMMMMMMMMMMMVTMMMMMMMMMVMMMMKHDHQ
jgi:hypothetical protein